MQTLQKSSEQRILMRLCRIAAIAIWFYPFWAGAAVLWQSPQPVKVTNQNEEILHGALAPRDDSASETLYLKLRVNPLSDVVEETLGRHYAAGLVFYRGDTENLGIGNAWDAWGYGAMYRGFKFPGNKPREFTFQSEVPEVGGRYPYLGPRRDAFKTLVVKVEYVPGAEDRITVWLNPDLGPNATETGQSERTVNRFNADASFDQFRLMHRGSGAGWVFEDITVASEFDDFVPKPFWRRPWFLSVAGIALLTAVVGVAVAAERHRARRRMAIVEREQAVAAERVRIAQDLHDDLGAKLTEIVLLGEVAAKPGGEEQASVREMLQGLRQLHGSLDEAVWSINPSNDSLAHLVEYMSEFAQRFVRNAPVAFHLEVAAELPPIHLTASQRHNLLLAVKEALNNAVRHAQASTIWLKIARADDRIRIEVVDDGCGMESSRQSTGDGLRNMPQRLAAIGGTAEIHSQPGKGTKIVFELPIQT